MKAVLSLAAFFASTILAATIPDENGWYLRRANEMHLEYLPIVDLQITEPRFGDRVFNGTVEAVYAQMKAEKPELFLNEKRYDAETLSRSLSLSKRQGTVNCGWPSNNVNDRVSQWNNCIEGITYLMNLGQAICGVPAAPACSRVSCSHNCGMFLCNKLNREYKMHCDSIPADINAIATECQDSVGRVWGARDWATHYLGLRKQSC